MAYSFEQLLAADPSNPSNIAQNGSITIFAPGDETMTPLTITDPDGSPLPNPFTVNANGFGPAFAHATLDRVAWSGGGFTGFVTSYEGMKAEAIAARTAAESAAATAGADAAAVADAAIGDATAEATAAKTAAEAAASNASASATAAANSAALVGAPADSAIAAAVNNSASATKAALNATFDTRLGTTAADPTSTLGKTFARGVNVTDPRFGAKGDGTTDDSAAINAAFAASKRVHFPAGTYLAAALTISTAGTVVTGDGAKIVKKTAGPLVTVTPTGSQVKISGLHLDGATLAGPGFRTNAVDTVFENCTVERMGTDLPAIHGHPAGGGVSTNMAVRRCTVIGEIRIDNADGLLVDDCDITGMVNVWAVNATTSHADRFRITNNRIRVPLNMFGVTPLSRNGAVMPRDGVISGNTFTLDVDCHGAISVDTNSGTRVQNNTFEAVAGVIQTALVEVVSSKKTLIVGNAFKGNNLATLVTLNGSSDTIVSDNQMDDPNYAALDIKAPAAGSVTSGNRITGNRIRLTSPTSGSRYGVYVTTNNATAAARQNTITGNKISANAATGIRAIKMDQNSGTLTDTTISLNEIDTAVVGIEVYADTNTTLRGNKIAGATTTIVRNGGATTGTVVEGNSWQYAAAAPTTGYHHVGERVANTAPAVGAPKGWVCTVAGTPGTWVSEGNL